MPKLLGQLLAIGLGLVGPLVALVLGVLTFGGQATVTPDHLPLAVGPTDAASALALSSVVDRVSAQSGDAVSWRKVSSRADAEDLLDHKEIYGAVLFRPTPGGLTATVLVSGAINPTATQAAQQALTQVAIGVTAAARAQAPVASDARQAVPPVQVITIHPTSAAGRTTARFASRMT